MWISDFDKLRFVDGRKFVDFVKLRCDCLLKWNIIFLEKVWEKWLFKLFILNILCLIFILDSYKLLVYENIMMLIFIFIIWWNFS